MNNQHLQNYCHFDETELATNRNGALSERQLKRLSAGSAKGLRLILACMMFGLSACLIFFLFAILPQIQGSLEKIIWPAFLGLFILVTALLGLFFIRGVFKKPVTKLEKAEGPVHIAAVERTDSKFKKYTSHALQVGGERFWVTSILASYINQGEVYAVYFVRDALHSDLQFTNIVSIESLSVQV
jgi:hypothetical protein